MKKALKVIGILFLILILMSMFRSCGGNSTRSSLSNNSTEKSETEKEEIEITLDEQELYNDNDVVIKATGIEKTFTGYDVSIYIENNSSKDYSINAHASAVNGLSTNNNIYDMDCDVASGKKANTTYEIKNSFLNENGIDVVKSIKLLVWAYDKAKSFKDFETDQLLIKTSAYDDTLFDISGTEVLSNDTFSVEYLGSNDGQYAFVIKNKTDSYFAFNLENLSINDYTVSDDYRDYDLYNAYVLGNTEFIMIIEPDSDFLSANNIETIESLSFSFDYRINDDYYEEKSSDKIELSEL